MENDSPTRKPAFLTQMCEEQLDEAMTFIAANSPRQAEIMEEQFHEIRKIIETMPGIRKFLLGKFPYYIYYRENETTIDMLGIWHTSRGADFAEPETQA